jgi:hypothetical protein
MRPCGVDTPAYAEACPNVVIAALFAGEADAVANGPVMISDGVMLIVAVPPPPEFVSPTTAKSFSRPVL